VCLLPVERNSGKHSSVPVRVRAAVKVSVTVHAAFPIEFGSRHTPSVGCVECLNFQAALKIAKNFYKKTATALRERIPITSEECGPQWLDT
jgi:hypothetical protein